MQNATPEGWEVVGSSGIYHDKLSDRSSAGPVSQSDVPESQKSILKTISAEGRGGGGGARIKQNIFTGTVLRWPGLDSNPREALASAPTKYNSDIKPFARRRDVFPGSRCDVEACSIIAGFGIRSPECHVRKPQRQLTQP